jgi:predicted nuclease with TOPRIM domain
MDPILKTIIEFRDEMRDFRTETRATLGRHSHRLNVIEATAAGLKTDAGVLLGSVPVLDERLDSLEARVAALEARS